LKQLLSFIASVAFATGIAFAQDAPSPAPSPIAPSVVVAAPSTYDMQTITVTGTIKGVQTRSMRRGTLTQYQLCDTQCINVVQFGDQTGSLTDGATTTVTGRFRASVDRGPMHAQNLLMVGGGGFPGRGHRGGYQPNPQPT